MRHPGARATEALDGRGGEVPQGVPTGCRGGRPPDRTGPVRAAVGRAPAARRRWRTRGVRRHGPRPGEPRRRPCLPEHRTGMSLVGRRRTPTSHRPGAVGQRPGSRTSRRRAPAGPAVHRDGSHVPATAPSAPGPPWRVRARCGVQAIAGGRGRSRGSERSSGTARSTVAGGQGAADGSAGRRNGERGTETTIRGHPGKGATGSGVLDGERGRRPRPAAVVTPGASPGCWRRRAGVRRR